MKVSIIIPVYNASSFILDCMESVEKQTMTEGLECILIEDCSKDNTIAVIEDYIKNYKGQVCFVLQKQDNNQGPSAARNRGIREAKGDYLFFLDADDTIEPDCIELLYGLAKKYDADYVQGRYNVNENVNENETLCYENENILPRFLDDRREIKRLLLNHNKIQFTPHNRLVRRDMVLEHKLFFDEEIAVREDFLWMTFVAKYVERFASCDNPTYCRGYNEDSLTNNINFEREIKGYRVLIETMVANYDAFQLGAQKELAVEALLMALRSGYYHNEKERQRLVTTISSRNNSIENLLLQFYLRTENSHVLHLLIRLYKRNN